MLRQKFRDFVKLKHEKQEHSASRERTQLKFDTPASTNKLRTKSSKYGENTDSRPQSNTKNCDSSSPSNKRQNERLNQYRRARQNTKIPPSNQRNAGENFQSKFFNTCNIFTQDFLVKEDAKNIKNCDVNTVDKTDQNKPNNDNHLFIKTFDGEELNNDLNSEVNDDELHESIEREVPVPMQTSFTTYSDESKNSPRFAHELSPKQETSSKAQQDLKDYNEEKEPLDFINYAYRQIIVQKNKFIN